MSLTQARLKELLHYDPLTGGFTWLIRKGPNALVGASAGSTDAKGYIVIVLDGKTYKAHRLAWLYMTGKWPKDQIDHKDMAQDNNRWINLREATRSQNMRNCTKYASNKSGFKGVHWCKKTKRWIAQIMLDGHVHNLGYHDTPEAAHTAYCEAAPQHHGEFARTN